MKHPRSFRWIVRGAAACVLVSAVFAGGSEPSGAEPRVRLTTQHVDFRVVYSPGTSNELFLVARDGDARTNYFSTNVVLVVQPPAETTIPDGFPELGEPGQPLWILPSTQNVELLYLGVSGEGLPAGVFDRPPEVRLVAVEAPGSFLVWQFDSTGVLKMFMDSRDGIDPEDVIAAPVGGHGHFYWGFTSNGFFEVTFRVEGRLAGAATNLLAADTSFRFAVEPLPPEPPPAALAVIGVDGAETNQLVCRLTGAVGVAYRVLTSRDLRVWDEGPEVVAAATPVEFMVSLPESGEQPFFLRAVARPF